MISLTCESKKYKKLVNVTEKAAHSYTENKAAVVVAGGGGRGGGSKTGVED